MQKYKCKNIKYWKDLTADFEKIRLNLRVINRFDLVQVIFVLKCRCTDF